MAREPKHWRDMEDSICELRTWAILIHSINSDIWEECKREKTPNGRERISVDSDKLNALAFALSEMTEIAIGLPGEFYDCWDSEATHGDLRGNNDH